MELIQVEHERRHRRPFRARAKAHRLVTATTTRRSRTPVATEIVVVRLVRDVFEGDAEWAVAEVRHVNRHLLVHALFAHRLHRRAMVPMKRSDVMRKQFVRPDLGAQHQRTRGDS